MGLTDDDERLSAKRYVLVLLRLLVDERGRLVYGELMGTGGRSWGHFDAWDELPRLAQAWMSAQQGGSPPAGAPNPGG